MRREGRRREGEVYVMDRTEESKVGWRKRKTRNGVRILCEGAG